MRKYQKLKTYNALTGKEIEMASQRNIKYNFEGLIVKNISKSFREYGKESKRYYLRISLFYLCREVA